MGAAVILHVFQVESFGQVLSHFMDVSLCSAVAVQGVSAQSEP